MTKEGKTRKNSTQTNYIKTDDKINQAKGEVRKQTP